MTTDSIHYKTTTQIIHDGSWHMEKIHISPETWKAVQEQSNKNHLKPEILLAFTAALSLKTWLDLADQDADEQLNIISKNDFSSLLLNPVPENMIWNQSFLKYCTDLNDSLASDPNTSADLLTNRCSVILHHDSSDFKIPIITSSVLITITIAEDVQIEWYAKPEFLSQERLKSLANTHKYLLDWSSQENWEQSLPYLLCEQERTVRNEVNQTETEIQPELIHQAFFQHALQNPGDIALYWEDNQSSQMSYGELADNSLKLSRILADNGAQSDSRVAVVLPKGPSQIIAVMGILGSGVLYIPVGVDQPAGRQEKIFKKAEVQFIVTDSSTLSDFPHLKNLAQEQYWKGSDEAMAFVHRAFL